MYGIAKLGPACQPRQSRDKLAYQPEFKHLLTRRGLLFDNTEVGNSNKKKEDTNQFDHLLLSSGNVK